MPTLSPRRAGAGFARWSRSLVRRKRFQHHRRLGFMPAWSETVHPLPSTQSRNFTTVGTLAGNAKLASGVLENQVVMGKKAVMEKKRSFGGQAGGTGFATARAIEA